MKIPLPDSGPYWRWLGGIKPPQCTQDNDECTQPAVASVGTNGELSCWIHLVRREAARLKKVQDDGPDY